MKAYSDIIRHIQAYSSRFRNYSDISLTLCNPDKFRTLVCSESWYIQNQRHIQNPGIFKNLVQSEPETYIQNREIFRTGGILRTLSNIYDGAIQETANGYNFFRNINISCPLFHEINMIFQCRSNFYYRSPYSI